MSKTLTSNFLVKTAWNHVNTTASGKTVPDQSDDGYSLSLTSGTGANGTADLKFFNVYTLAGAATQALDLAGVLTDEFGATLTFARVKEIQVRVLGADEDAASVGGPVDVGGSGVGTSLLNWISSATAKVRVGGTAGRKACLHLSCDDAVAYAVTAATGDILLLTNVHATLAVKVAVTLIGAST